MAAWSHRAADADLTRRLAAALGVSDPVAAVLATVDPTIRNVPDTSPNAALFPRRTVPALIVVPPV